MLFAFVSAWVAGKNLNTPNISSMPDNIITQGCIRIGGLLSPFYICGQHKLMRVVSERKMKIKQFLFYHILITVLKIMCLTSLNKHDK